MTKIAVTIDATIKPQVCHWSWTKAANTSSNPLIPPRYERNFATGITVTNDATNNCQDAVGKGGNNT